MLKYLPLLLLEPAPQARAHVLHARFDHRRVPAVRPAEGDPQRASRSASEVAGADRLVDDAQGVVHPVASRQAT